jgi:hypothetical protein
VRDVVSYLETRIAETKAKYKGKCWHLIEKSEEEEVEEIIIYVTSVTYSVAYTSHTSITSRSKGNYK